MVLQSLQLAGGRDDTGAHVEGVQLHLRADVLILLLEAKDLRHPLLLHGLQLLGLVPESFLKLHQRETTVGLVITRT